MIREERQEEAIQAYLDGDRRQIINSCCRFGKTKCAIEVLRRGKYRKPTIIAPRLDIEKSWKDEFDRVGYWPFYNFLTTKSIRKVEARKTDIFIVDEIHEMSENQQKQLAEKAGDIPILGLSGTMTKKTEGELFNNLNLNICYKYTIAQGVEEGIIADYLLHIHKVKLGETEGVRFHQFEYLRDKQKIALQKYFFELKMINILQNSTAKLLKTKELLKEYEDERVLVFCGVTKIADQLGIPVYHSLKKEKEIFDNFCNGVGNHLATIQMMQAGITVIPISRGIVNYISGAPESSSQKICRLLGKEIFNPNKVAEIDIVVSDEPFELSRIRTALSFFDDSKIIYEN